MSQSAQIIGSVEYREGDGPNIAIRPGRVEVQTTASDATLSWTDKDTHGSAAIPLTDFERHVAEGRIRLDN
jgi:hypothetical protein